MKSQSMLDAALIAAKKLPKVKSRYFFIIAIVAGLVCTLQLSATRHHAANLASQIASLDSSGQDVTSQLGELSTYTSHHMLASTSVYLKGSYDRATAAANGSAVDPAIYSAAQAKCASHADSIAQSKCVSEYMAANAPQTNAQPQVQPSQADYTKTFVSPGWTPDGAGLSLLIGAVSAIVGIYLFIYRKL